jgi:hypothetical protein
VIGDVDSVGTCFVNSRRKIMDIEAVRSFAASQSIESGSRSKAELIKTIQLTEGNFDCFSSACRGECDQQGCYWREDCFSAAHEGASS